MNTNKQQNQNKSDQITLLTRTVHDESILTFKMPDYSKQSHYKDEGKPLLDQATLAIEMLNKQTLDLYRKQLNEKIEKTEKEIHELEEIRKRESEQQRKEDEAIIESLRDEIEQLIRCGKTKELKSETLRNISEAQNKEDEKKANTIKE